MTDVIDRPAAVPVDDRAPRRWPVLLSPGWIPMILVLAGTAWLLTYYGVSAADQIKFGAYTVLAGALPGVLIWRAMRGGAGYLPFDVAFGTTAGFAVELPVYLLARLGGHPVAVVAWPIATILLFAAVPRLRRYWRGSGERLPLGVSWTVAAGFLYVLAVVAVTNFRLNSMIEPFQSTMGADYPFQFALLGEFKHQVPLDTPWLAGTPLQYHWYVYAHGAAASWLTGIEPQVLILRLLPLPMIGAFLMIMVAVVRRISGRMWAGCLAVVLTLVGVSVSPFGWSDRPTFSGIIIDNLWVSPTQTYAALFFIATVDVLAGILRSTGPDRRRLAPWIAFVVLVGAVAGAKATFVPMVLCGLLFAVALRLIRTRRVGVELVALGITLCWFAFAQLVLYGSGTQGTEVNALQTVKWTDIGQAVNGRPTPVDRWNLLVPLFLLGLLGPAFAWVGLAGLLRRDWRIDPVVHVMLGFAAAGIGGLWIFAHPGLSQTYFARSASPYLAMLSAIGLAALIPAGRRAPRWFVGLAIGGALLAATGLVVVQETVGKHAAPGLGAWPLSRAVMPYLVILGVLVALAVVVAVIARLVRLPRRYAAGAVVILVLAAAVTSGAANYRVITRAMTEKGGPLRYATTARSTPSIPPGAIEAGRWLRDNSDPRDLVATNSHCRAALKYCDSRDFWLAAYSERQILVEGWSYTEPAFETGGLWDRTLDLSKFWDPQLLAANDAVFYRPTAATVAAFTTEHRVRWLVAVDSAVSTDMRARRPVNTDPNLARFATERFRSARITVYEVTGGA